MTTIFRDKQSFVLSIPAYNSYSFTISKSYEIVIAFTNPHQNRLKSHSIAFY